jgi:hypothetical protein
MPEGVDQDAFLRLENDPAFIELIKKQAAEWLSRNHGIQQSSA